MKLLENYKMDLIVDSRISYREAILSLLEPNSQPSLLDLGSGDYRRVTRYAADTLNAKEVTTIDLDGLTSGGVEYGRPYRHYVHDLNTPWFGAAEYDVVLSSQVIEHVWNTDEFMRTAKKALKPDGYLVLSTPNLASWHNLAYLAMGKQPEVATVSNELYPWKEQPGHCRVFTSTELIKFATFHGFKVEKIVGSGYYPLIGKLAKLASQRDWRHAAIITLKARKA